MGLIIGQPHVPTASGPQGNCAEVTQHGPDRVSIRNNKRGPSIEFNRGEWLALLDAVRTGEMNLSD